MVSSLNNAPQDDPTGAGLITNDVLRALMDADRWTARRPNQASLAYPGQLKDTDNQHENSVR